MNRVELNNIMPQKLPPAWPRGLLVFMVVLFLLVAGAEGAVYYWNNNQSVKLNNTQNQFQTLQQNFPKDQQNKIALLEAKINTLQTLLKNHIYFSQGLTALERLTHPQVYYQSLIFDPNKKSLSLKGVALSSGVLSEALSGLVNDSKEINMVVLHQAKIEKNKSVDFAVDIYLKPQVFLYHSNSVNSPLGKANQDNNQ